MAAVNPAIKQFMPIRDDNIILGMYNKPFSGIQTLRLGLERGNNTNGLIIGAAGMGKSFRFIKPNIMQLNTSYVITDPSGEIFSTLSRLLLESGYDVKLFSTSDQAHSMCYNPFDYVYDAEGEIDEAKVSTMVNMFQKNADGMQKANKGGDPFWEKSANALLTACAMYLLEFCAVTMQNFYNVLKLVQAGKESEDANGGGKTQLDLLFDKARKMNPEAHCFSSYDTFKLAPAKTANSILISAAVDLNKFNQDKIRNMTTTAYKVKKRNKRGEITEFAEERGNYIRTDENIDLFKIGDGPTALFVNTPQADPTFNFLVTMMYSQLYAVLYERGEKICPKRWQITGPDGRCAISMLKTESDARRVQELYKHATIKQEGKGEDAGWYIVAENPERSDKQFCLPGRKNGLLKKVYSEEVGLRFQQSVIDGTVEFKASTGLPWHVQFLLDEFANIGEIPEFPQKLATSRKYEISSVIVIQDISQLDDKYDKLKDTIFGNCAFILFLGSPTKTTTEYISGLLGKKTIKVKNRSKSNSGKGGSSSSSYNLDSRELMMPSEVGKLPNDQCLVLFSSEYNGTRFKIKKYNSTKHPNWKFHGGKDNKEWFQTPEDYVTCSNKIVNVENSKEVKKKQNENMLNGKSPEGKVMSRSSSLKTRSDILDFFRLPANGDVKDAGKQMKPPKPASADEEVKTPSKTGKMVPVDNTEFDVGDFDVPESNIKLG